MGREYGIHDLLLHAVLYGVLQLAVHVFGNFLAELLFTALFHAVGAEQLLVQGRRGQGLHAVDLDREADGGAAQLFVVVVLGEAQLECFLVTGLHADNAVLEAGDHAPGTQFQIAALGATTLEGLAVAGAGVVDIHPVAGFGGALDLVPAALLLAEHLDDVFDVGVTDLGHRTRHREALHLGNLNLGEDFEGGHVFEVLAGFEVARLDVGLPRGAQLFLDHRLLEAAAHDLAQHFLTHTGAEALAHHLHRHLAGAEAGQAHVTGRLLQPGIDFAVYLCGGYADGQTALQAGSRFNGHLHRFSSQT